MNNVDLSVVIVSFNTKSILLQCLRQLNGALKALSDERKLKGEVIVVDNASTDGSVEMVEKKFPKVKVIRSDKNLGFAGGNNLGMKKAAGKWLLLLNSDAYVKPDTLIKGADFAEKHPEFEVVGCKLSWESGKLQPSAGYFPTPGNVLFWWLGVGVLPGMENVIKLVHPVSQEFYSKTREVDWVTGAYMWMNREVFEKTNGFDENLFMYMEEVEWCRRIQQSGFKIGFTSDYEIVHLGRASSGFNDSKALMGEVRGLVYFIKKYYPGSLTGVKMAVGVGSMARWLAFNLLGKFDKARAYLEIIKFIWTS